MDKRNLSPKIACNCARVGRKTTSSALRDGPTPANYWEGGLKRKKDETLLYVIFLGVEAVNCSLEGTKRKNEGSFMFQGKKKSSQKVSGGWGALLTSLV